MILEYHMLGPEEDRWTRSYVNFWNDLETLYAKGFRPIGLHDLIDNRIDTPAGYTPIVLTFDDSSPMQFRLVPGPSGEPIVDPKSAVGLLERFHQLHPDFPLKATFFVLPGADPPHDLFGQKDLKERKIRYLVERGFEIGNHTFHHHRLDILNTQAEVAAQLGRSVQALQRIVPGYRVRTLALPLGMFPADETWVRSGSHEGTVYEHDLVLLATGGGTVPPNHREWDPFRVPRIQATSLELDFRTVYVDFYDRHPEKRFISDGIPDVLSFPRAAEADYRPDKRHVAVDLPRAVADEFRALRLR